MVTTTTMAGPWVQLFGTSRGSRNQAGLRKRAVEAKEEKNKNSTRVVQVEKESNTMHMGPWKGSGAAELRHGL